MYQKILVAVDGSTASDRALDEALKLALSERAALRIIHVVDEVFLSDLEMIDIELVRRALHENGRQILNQARSAAERAGVAAEARLVEIGQPGLRIASRIIDEARSWPADLVVLGTHGRRGLDQLLVGSVAEGVVRIAPMPVLLVRRE